MSCRLASQELDIDNTSHNKNCLEAAIALQHVAPGRGVRQRTSPRAIVVRLRPARSPLDLMLGKKFSLGRTSSQAEISESTRAPS